MYTPRTLTADMTKFAQTLVLLLLTTTTTKTASTITATTTIQDSWHIFYTNRIIAHFVSDFVAIATGGQLDIWKTL